MIPDNNAHVIVHNSYGSASVYACTLENAKTLYANYRSNLRPTTLAVMEQLKDPQWYAVSNGIVRRAVEEILTKPVDTEGSYLRNLMHGRAPKTGDDTRPVEMITQALKESMALIAFRCNVAPKDFASHVDYQLAELSPETWSILQGVYARASAGQKKPLFLQDYELEMAEEVRVLEAGNWKETAQEVSVVGRYLRFIQDSLVGRDEKFEVSQLTTP